MASVGCCNINNFYFRGRSTFDKAMIATSITGTVLAILFTLRAFAVLPRPPHWPPVASIPIKIGSILAIVIGIASTIFILRIPPAQADELRQLRLLYYRERRAARRAALDAR